jgi:hypothetical protein
MFFSYNTSGTGKISLTELKIMMEKLGAPQTHLALKAMIEVRNSFSLESYLVHLSFI